MVVGHYVRAEAGVDKPTFRVPRIRVLAAHERCVIMRRRSGMTQEYVADRLGYCRRWIQLMEMGKINPTPLLRFFRE